MSRKLTFLLLSGSIFTTPFTLANTPPNQVDKLLEQAQTLLGDDPDEAEEKIEAALELAPKRADVHFLCGQVMGIQASQSIFSALSYAGKSLDCFKQAATLEPANTEYKYGLMMFYLGAPGIAGGDTELAWQQVQDIAALDEQAGLRAKLNYYRQTDKEKAYAETMAQALASYPDHAEFYYQHGLTLQQQEQYEAALAAFQQATNATIDDEEAHFRLSALYQIGRNAVFSKQAVKEGIDALLAYIQAIPPDASLPSAQWAHFRLAQLYRLTSATDAVKQHLKLAANTDDKQLQDNIDDF
jgi:tetratricopeptide (TPR) repeat protein